MRCRLCRQFQSSSSRRWGFWSGLAALLTLPGCSGPDVVNALVPSEGYRVVHDQRYGEGPRRTLDLYIPEAPLGDRPVVVFFYGGGWESGSKKDYLFVGEALAARGYVTAIPDYRLYPEVRYPDFLEDAAAAVAWVSRNVANTGMESGPVYLMGHSAGAYIAAMLTLDGRWLDRAGAPACDTVAAMAGLAGPYDFLPLQDETLKDIFGPESTRARTQPIHYVDGRAAPMLLMTGGKDTTVDPRNTRRLAARIRDRGGEVEERLYSRTGHIMLVGSLARPFRGWTTALDDVDAWFSRHTTVDSDGCAPGERR